MFFSRLSLFSSPFYLLIQMAVMKGFTALVHISSESGLGCLFLIFYRGMEGKKELDKSLFLGVWPGGAFIFYFF